MGKFSEIYECLETRNIAECAGTGKLYRHKKTGARVFTINCADKNKVFLIGFRTTPKDSTGVAHIMEHSVLCGSERFPIKDPFVELAKGSLNTFLNAMTYPDKTVYPVASCNEQDFKNLMDVYLDAVLHPNIYNEPKIFQQEGWHYELESPEGELRYNGVVYNEMKGAFSNPDAVLERYTMHALFPDTTYGFESGGDPDCIPTLSYKEFIRFHETYYHPSNSYIYLYGDQDMEETLLWMDERYLSKYSYQAVNSRIQPQKPFRTPKRETVVYPIGENESEAHRTYLSENYVIGDELSKELYLGWQILEFVLLNAPGAPLKEALIAAGIGEDILGGYTQGVLQPYFSIIAKNAEETDRQRFRDVIRETLEGLVKNGIDQKQLAAALNYTEFKYREADYGRMPAGLIYGLTALDSWLYDGSPYLHLAYESTLQFLKEQAQNRYFEGLIDHYLLHNHFRAEVSIVPKKGLTAERDAKLRAKLAEKKASLSQEALEALCKDTQALKQYQEADTPPEALRTLPVLKISDISPEAETSCLKVLPSGLLYSDFETRGVAYVHVLFRTAGLTEEELQFASFLRYLYGEIDTEKHGYQDLGSEVLMYTGGLDFDLVSYPKMDKSGGFTGVFSAELRVLAERLSFGMDMLLEILTESSFADEKRIGDKLLEAKSRMQMKIDGASHSAAVCRAGSYYNQAQRFDDLTSGIAFYEFLDASAKFWQEPVHRKRWLKSLAAVAEKLFTKERAVFALAGTKTERAALEDLLPAFQNGLFVPQQKATDAETAASAACSDGVSVTALDASASPASATAALPEDVLRPLGQLNEGLKTASQVNYVARCGSFAAAGPYTGALQVLRVLLNYEYLWLNLRVKGGAYGCMSGFAKSGRAYLVSYRDPEIGRTNEIYEALPDWLAKLELSEEQLTKYIIGAVAELDMPITASIRASRELSKYFSGLTDADFARERAEVLGCSAEALRALAPYVKALLNADCICAIGNAEKIEQDSRLFRSVRALYA